MADAPRAAASVDQPRQIGEIAVPPIAARAQRVKLYRQSPEPTAVALKGALRSAAARRCRCRDGRAWPAEIAAISRAKISGLALVPLAQNVIIFGFDAPKPRAGRDRPSFRLFFASG